MRIQRPKSKVVRIEDDYLKLVKSFPLRRLRGEADHQAALETSGKLIGLVRRLSSGETDYLEALATLIVDYETRTRENPPVKRSGLHMVKFLVTESAMTVRDFGKLLGVGPAAASLILSGKRELTKSHIAALAAHFHVGPQLFFD